MAQYTPLATNLGVGNYGTNYDRCTVFPINAAAIVASSIDVWVAAGHQVRAALYSGISASTTTGATLIFDFGIVTNVGVSDAFINVSAPPGTTLPIGVYPVICERQGLDIGIVGDGSYPFGDVIYASRNFNGGSDTIATAFPSTVYSDEGTAVPFRIPYARLNYTVAATTSIDTVTTAGNPGLVVGQPFAITTTGLGTLAEIDIQTLGVLGSTVVATSLSAPSGDGTATMPYWVNGQKYPKIGTARVTAVETGGTPNAADGDFTLSLPSTYISQTFASVLLPDATWLGYVLNAISHPLADNDRAYWPDVNGLTFGADSKISVTLADGATMVTDLWIQKVDSTMEYYSLTINSSGSASITKNNRLWIGIGAGI